MYCERCGDTMRPETIIKLRRSFGRVWARHFHGAYCASCKASVSTEEDAARYSGGFSAGLASAAGWMTHRSASQNARPKAAAFIAATQ
jgi:hypothetical protein